MSSSVATISTSPADLAKRLIDNVSKALRGKHDVVELAAVALIANGHLLLEDVPGVGKTTLARALAASLGLQFRRLQCTSDLMPSDVIGGSVFNQTDASFSFRAGPVFTQLLLADEINRSTPKTQSALLEAMDERRVSVDGVTRELPSPFFVIATQNPKEFYGTYPLPESQLDRFLLRLSVGYPSPTVEREVLEARLHTDAVAELRPVMGERELRHMQMAVESVSVDASVLDYIHMIILATRRSDSLDIGVSMRGAIGFERAVRALALVRGRSFVTPDDVKILVLPTLAHRIKLSGVVGASATHDDAERVLREVTRHVRVPT